LNQIKSRRATMSKPTNEKKKKKIRNTKMSQSVWKDV